MNNHLGKPAAQTLGILENLFAGHFGRNPETVVTLGVSGSDRRYYRLTGGGDSVIGTYNANVAENNAFFYATELFRRHGISVPEVYTINKDRRAYLQQDLGNVSLFDRVVGDGYTDEVRKLYHKSLHQLAKVQWIAGRDADYRQCFTSRQFDEKAIMADLLYFKYYFADLQDIPYNRAAMADEMELLSRDLGRVQPQTLMYRDFQSRNIMLHEDKPYFIDYQGFMQGPPQYDLASVLWQAKARLPEAWKEDLLNGYISALGDLHVPRMDEIYFRRGYVQFVLIRLLQVLGAYGFRGLLQQKTHFITSIGPALQHLSLFLESHPQTPPYPELRTFLEKVSSAEIQKKYAAAVAPQAPALKVYIESFSYKNGIPTTNSPHGGGYVFDCRGIENPGRYEPYRHLSGLDTPVQQFLERESTMPDFMSHVNAVVGMHVTNFIERGFDELRVSFGCTGGRHRSVYAAEKLANYLKYRFGIEAAPVHTNRENWD
jgi:aminoglycoside/choline kinase family phosphotransferase